mgnify:CR=1 FL=1
MAAAASPPPHHDDIAREEGMTFHNDANCKRHLNRFSDDPAATAYVPLVLVLADSTLYAPSASCPGAKEGESAAQTTTTTSAAAAMPRTGASGDPFPRSYADIVSAIGELAGIPRDVDLGNRKKQQSAMGVKLAAGPWHFGVFGGDCLSAYGSEEEQGSVGTDGANSTILPAAVVAVLAQSPRYVRPLGHQYGLIHAADIVVAVTHDAQHAAWRPHMACPPPVVAPSTEAASSVVETDVEEVAAPACGWLKAVTVAVQSARRLRQSADASVPNVAGIIVRYQRGGEGGAGGSALSTSAGEGGPSGDADNARAALNDTASSLLWNNFAGASRIDTAAVSATAASIPVARSIHEAVSLVRTHVAPFHRFVPSSVRASSSSTSTTSSSSAGRSWWMTPLRMICIGTFPKLNVILVRVMSGTLRVGDSVSFMNAVRHRGLVRSMQHFPSKASLRTATAGVMCGIQLNVADSRIVDSLALPVLPPILSIGGHAPPEVAPLPLYMARITLSMDMPSSLNAQLSRDPASVGGNCFTLFSSSGGHHVRVLARQAPRSLLVIADPNGAANRGWPSVDWQASWSYPAMSAPASSSSQPHEDEVGQQPAVPREATTSVHPQVGSTAEAKTTTTAASGASIFCLFGAVDRVVALTTCVARIDAEWSRGCLLQRVCRAIVDHRQPRRLPIPQQSMIQDDESGGEDPLPLAAAARSSHLSHSTDTVSSGGNNQTTAAAAPAAAAPRSHPSPPLMESLIRPFVDRCNRFVMEWPPLRTAVAAATRATVDASPLQFTKPVAAADDNVTTLFPHDQWLVAALVVAPGGLWFGTSQETVRQWVRQTTGGDPMANARSRKCLERSLRFDLLVTGVFAELMGDVSTSRLFFEPPVKGGIFDFIGSSEAPISVAALVSRLREERSKGGEGACSHGLEQPILRDLLCFCYRLYDECRDVEANFPSSYTDHWWPFFYTVDKYIGRSELPRCHTFLCLRNDLTRSGVDQAGPYPTLRAFATCPARLRMCRAAEIRSRSKPQNVVDTFAREIQGLLIADRWPLVLSLVREHRLNSSAGPGKTALWIALNYVLGAKATHAKTALVHFTSLRSLMFFLLFMIDEQDRNATVGIPGYSEFASQCLAGAWVRSKLPNEHSPRTVCLVYWLSYLHRSLRRRQSAESPPPSLCSAAAPPRGAAGDRLDHRSSGLGVNPSPRGGSPFLRLLANWGLIVQILQHCA